MEEGKGTATTALELSTYCYLSTVFTVARVQHRALPAPLPSDLPQLLQVLVLREVSGDKQPLSAL